MATRTGRAPIRSDAPGAGSRSAPQKVGKIGAIDLTEKRTAENPLASPSTAHLPHERDEVVGETGAVPSEKVRQGYRDLKRGLQDTSRAPEADAAYEKLKK